jgi:rhodanese-related sulfurtransferase
MEGGSEAWLKEGFPVYGNEKAAQGTAASAPKRVVPLPERISAADLKRLLSDLPGTFDLVDIRPADQFADYSLPGSRNVEIADIVNNPAFLTGAGPLVVVDRDGSLAMAVAGILSQKTARAIKALYGGLDAYWAESELKPAVREVPITGGAAMSAPSAAPPIQPSAPAAPSMSAPAPKKKSAGC